MMRALADALAARGLSVEWSATSRELEPAVIDAVRGGDIVVVKGSNGSRMAPIVGALRQHHARLLDETSDSAETSADTSMSRATA